VASIFLRSFLWIREGGLGIVEAGSPIQVLDLTKRFTVKKQLTEGELGLANLLKRTFLLKRTKEKLTAVDGVSFSVQRG